MKDCQGDYTECLNAGRIRELESKLVEALKERDARVDELSEQDGKIDALEARLDTIRKLVAGLPPTGEPVLVARWLIDDLKEAAK